MRTTMIRRLATVVVATYCLIASSAFGATGTVCEDAVLGGSLKGLCNAYCEAMDCDAYPSADVSACEAVHAKFVQKSGGLEPPCISPPVSDTDGDGISDDLDNCAFTTNADQSDLDEDGVGDACDNCVHASNSEQTDVDADGVGDSCDNCQVEPNADQGDLDADGVGNQCDTCTDKDNDGYGDADYDRSGCPKPEPDCYDGSPEIGACLKSNGQSCTENSQCASGNCADTFCCDRPCEGDCVACDLPADIGTCITLDENYMCESGLGFCDGVNPICPVP